MTRQGGEGGLSILERPVGLDSDRSSHTAARGARRWAGAARTLLHRRPDVPVLFVALAGGAALRLVGLGAVGLNSDEAVYAAQAGSLAGNPRLTALFPILRAHPLLFQVFISPLYASGAPGESGRYVAAAFGIATILVVYLTGRLLFNPLAGSIAALMLAAMPYHVVISRQILLDGPMTFFATLALCAMAQAGRTGRGRYLIAAGAAIGAAALCKEPAVVLVASLFAFVALTRRLWRPAWYPLAGMALAVALTAAYPVLTSLSGGSSSGHSYLSWQLTRPPNHTAAFYPVTVGGSIGFVIIAVAAVGLVVFWRIGWQGRLLVAWAAVPVVFFEFWPTQGFSYLMPVAPVVALLAARTVDRIAAAGLAARWSVRRGGAPGLSRFVMLGVAALVATACIAIPAVTTIRGEIDSANSGLAGGGGTPGGRAAAQWIGANAPPGAVVMTIGPSMANIVQFYGDRAADALSVSPNPLHRNPTYHAIANANAALRNGDYQYIVWDAYSAARSPNFGTRAEQLIQRFGGRAVDVQRGTFRGRPDQVLVVVYRVTRGSAAAAGSGVAPARPAVARADRVTLYGGYAAALAVATAAGIFAVIGTRRIRTRWLRLRRQRPRRLATQRARRSP